MAVLGDPPSVAIEVTVGPSSTPSAVLGVTVTVRSSRRRMRSKSAISSKQTLPQRRQKPPLLRLLLLERGKLQ